MLINHKQINFFQISQLVKTFGCLLQKQNNSTKVEEDGRLHDTQTVTFKTTNPKYFPSVNNKF